MTTTKHLYNRITFANGNKGYFVQACPNCSYAIEDCVRTREFTLCPLCARTGKQVKLEPRQVVTWPNFNVKRVHLPPGQDQDT